MKTEKEHKKTTAELLVEHLLLGLWAVRSPLSPLTGAKGNGVPEMLDVHKKAGHRLLSLYLYPCRLRNEPLNMEENTNSGWVTKTAINFICCYQTFKVLDGNANSKKQDKTTNIEKTKEGFHKLFQRRGFPHLLNGQTLPEFPLK